MPASIVDTFVVMASLSERLYPKWGKPFDVHFEYDQQRLKEQPDREHILWVTYHWNLVWPTWPEAWPSIVDAAPKAGKVYPGHSRGTEQLPGNSRNAGTTSQDLVAAGMYPRLVDAQSAVENAQLAAAAAVVAAAAAAAVDAKNSLVVGIDNTREEEKHEVVAKSATAAALAFEQGSVTKTTLVQTVVKAGLAV